MFFYLLCGVALLVLSTKVLINYSGPRWIIAGIYAVIFCTGIIRSFVGPSFSAIVGQIVPKNILANATTWNQGCYLSASVIGHACAGFFIAAFSNSGTLIAVVSLLSISIFLLSRIHAKPAKNLAGEKRTWDSVREGLSFVFNTKEVLGALTLDLFAVLFGGAVALVPIYAKDILKVGPIGFGWLNAAADIGAIVIVILLALFPLKSQQGRKLLLAVGAFGICIIIFGISKIFWISFAALLFSGMLDGISVVVRGTILQLKTPDHMRGRVMSVNSMFINSSNELGQFESGVTARLMGVVPSVVFGGCMTLMIVIITWFKSPTLKKMEY
jgi:MFS family permease